MATIDDKIFRFICIAAKRDATLQKSYKGEKKWLEGEEMAMYNFCLMNGD